MSGDRMPVRECWARYTDRTGRSWVREHLVWDFDRFVAARQAEHRGEGGKVEFITQEQYKAERVR